MASRKRSPATTAIRRGGLEPSQPVRKLLEAEALPTIAEALERRVKPRILDYGCGWGGDVGYLSQHYHKAMEVLGYEPAWLASEAGRRLRTRMPAGYFDAVLLVYVLNTVGPSHEDRNAVLQRAWDYVMPGGFLFVATRTFRELADQARRGRWVRQGYGWRTRSGTYQHPYDASTLSVIMHMKLRDLRVVEILEEQSFTGLLGYREGGTTT